MKEANKDAMLGTIREQPALIRELYENRKTITKPFVDFFLAHDVKKIYFSGHGAALNDALWIEPFMEMILDVDVEHCTLQVIIILYYIFSGILLRLLYNK